MFTVAVGDHIGQLIGTGIGESGSCPLYIILLTPLSHTTPNFLDLCIFLLDYLRYLHNRLK